MFPEALTREERRTACAAFDKPIMANMANGGLAPMLKSDVLADIGYAFAIYPSLTSLIASSAIDEALIRLRDQEDGEPADMSMFDKTFCSPNVFEKVRAFKKKRAQ